MALPSAQGLYDPQFEKDACGVGCVASLGSSGTHAVVAQALEILGNLTHRGAAGCDPCTGDGAGILLQIPHDLFASADAGTQGFTVPEPGRYAVAMCFFSPDPGRRRRQEAILEAAVEHHGQDVLGWRNVPTRPATLGPIARASMPVVRQLFIGHRPWAASRKATFEQILYVIRKRSGRKAQMELGGDDFYVASCSSRTVVYKGLMLPEHIAEFYPDLSDPRTTSRLAMVHSRFSTNTFPTWERAHPFRLLCHNGEINTLSGNQAWMASRESLLQSDVFGEAIEDFRPIMRAGGSDSAALDNVVDFLVASGRSLPHVMMMLIPKAYSGDLEMPASEKAFYAYHGSLMEPWDGPAALAFTDGRILGALLDRNGLRPGKYVVTSDGLVVLASEFGVLPIDPARVVRKGRIRPGKIFLVDTEEGRIIPDDEIRQQVTSQRPYAQWLHENRVRLSELEPGAAVAPVDDATLNQWHRAFGYNDEDLETILAPMATQGEEPVASMGIDTPLAVLSSKPQLLFRYFKQRFAQVTNPPIDPIREQVVMSLVTYLGQGGNLLEENPKQCHLLELPHPFLLNEDVARLRGCADPDFRAVTLSATFPVPAGWDERIWLDDEVDLPKEALRSAGVALRKSLDALCKAASAAVASKAGVLIVSDRDAGPGRAAMPSLLATAAVHHHLVRTGDRLRVGLVVETGDAREVAHACLLIGFGAAAVNPYVALETVTRLDPSGKARQHYIKALGKGLLKTMSKMGVSAVSSYQGAQIFEAIGIDQRVIDLYFTGAPSRIRGIGLSEIAEEALYRHHRAFSRQADGSLEVGGHHRLRLQGEPHLWTSASIAALQKSVRSNKDRGDPKSYAEYAKQINEPVGQPMTLRATWSLRPFGPAVPLEEVEPAAEIVKRFTTGAMSFGSISQEAHENLAIAMNRIGGKSNTGEGGEDPARWLPDANGDSRRSAIKQVASGRFGVTTEYLVNADDIQIKMAQGAKPGEGGQLPGHKVDAVIARVRHSTPGVTLISPPPHHDIYSIEDLAQLIFDLKNVNPRARISVKLVAEAGVGTIAAGVAKAHADVILISGHDGGTGAAPMTSIHHAGAPWELGLAEAQQVLMMNGLRSRVRLQADGQLKTGRDAIFSALLGAEEFGFATAPLVASGCIMMRKCHLNTCPVGVATQDPELRKRFQGKPEHVINYLFFVAEEMRSLLATLGFRRLDEAVGRTECIVPNAGNWETLHPRAARKVKTLDCSEVLHLPMEAQHSPRRCTESQDHNLRTVLDHKLIAQIEPLLESKESTVLDTPIRNGDRAFGSMLAGLLTQRLGSHIGLPDDHFQIRARGSAGQSFGAWACRGMSLALEGDANDYVGKGLSGGIISVRPDRNATFAPEKQVIVGNTVLYGATSGKAFFNGRAGERFAVRNSGATAVVEGLGDHGCEYMTGGLVLVLATVGRNFAAGMSGGVAFAFDKDGLFVRRCNLEMVALHMPEEQDLLTIRSLLNEHIQRTGSPLAQRMLSEWQEVAYKWVKVSPKETPAVAAHAARNKTSSVPAAKPYQPWINLVSGGTVKAKVVHG